MTAAAFQAAEFNPTALAMFSLPTRSGTNAWRVGLSIAMMQALQNERKRICQTVMMPVKSSRPSMSATTPAEVWVKISR